MLIKWQRGNQGSRMSTFVVSSSDSVLNRAETKCIKIEVEQFMQSRPFSLMKSYGTLPAKRVV